MIHHRILTRKELMDRLTCDEYDLWKAADELGLFPDPVIETAKLRATIVASMSLSKRPVDIADFLPDVLVPGPVIDPEDEARKMAAFANAMKARLG